MYLLRGDTHDVHGKCLIFRTPPPPHPPVHLPPKYFYPLDLRRPLFKNTLRTLAIYPPPPTSDNISFLS